MDESKNLKKRGRKRSGAAPKMPFSLILEPWMLDSLKKMAAGEKVSVAVVVRQAILRVLLEKDPEIATRVLDVEVDSFLAHIEGTFTLTPAKKARMKKAFLASVSTK